MVVYMLLGTLEPTPPDADAVPAVQNARPKDDQPYFPPEPTGFLPEIPYEYYPWIYSAKIALTLAAIVLVSGGYRAFPWKFHWLSVVVGVVGVVLWIGICHLQLEVKTSRT